MAKGEATDEIDINRYAIEIKSCRSGDHQISAEENPDGEWLKWEDVALYLAEFGVRRRLKHGEQIMEIADGLANSGVNDPAAYIAELEEDRKRLDWLESGGGLARYSGGLVEFYWNREFVPRGADAAPSAREAIDAAREADSTVEIPPRQVIDGQTIGPDPTELPEPLPVVVYGHFPPVVLEDDD